MTDSVALQRPPMAIRERRSLRQDVADIIREDIRQGRIGQGERIVESKLARELDVSLTPVREAVRELVGEGLLTICPNRGCSVRVLTPADAYELYSLRSQLEGLAIKLCVSHASIEQREKIRRILVRMEAAVDDPAVVSLQDDSLEIHEAIVRLSGHSRLIAFYASLSLQIALLNRLAARRSDKRHEVEWHRGVVNALVGDDPGAAEAVMHIHIRESYDAYLDAFAADRSAAFNPSPPRSWV